MPHDLWQLRQEWEAQPGTGNLLWTGLHIAGKTKKQSLAMDEEGCLAQNRSAAWRARSTQVGSCFPLPPRLLSTRANQNCSFASGRRGISRLTVGLIWENLSPVQQLSPRSWGLFTEQSLLEVQEGCGLVYKGVGWPVLKRQHLLRCYSPGYHASGGT